ncbi:MAG: hypothetical protein JKY70_04180 [Mucilaginibacter sp.]|nr:hypothetical protein [Mucilaginibacter sp.]
MVNSVDEYSQLGLHLRHYYKAQMKAYTLPYSNSVPFYQNGQEVAQPRAEEAGADKKHQLTTTEYLIGVLGEGLKQNFLGADINMEFLTLTVRSYATESVKAVRRFIGKATAGKNINSTSTNIS